MQDANCEELSARCERIGLGAAPQATMLGSLRYPSYIAAPYQYLQFLPEKTGKTEHA